MNAVNSSCQKRFDAKVSEDFGQCPWAVERKDNEDSGCEYPDSPFYVVDAGTRARVEGSDLCVGIASHLDRISCDFTKISFKHAGSRVECSKGLSSVEGPRHFDVVRGPFDCLIEESTPNSSPNRGRPTGTPSGRDGSP